MTAKDLADRVRKAFDEFITSPGGAERNALDDALDAYQGGTPIAPVAGATTIRQFAGPKASSSARELDTEVKGSLPPPDKPKGGASSDR